MATAAAATAPAVGAKPGSSTAAAADNDDNYAEDECTIDFGDEEPVVDTERHRTIGRNDLQQTLNREYHGEDFSHYLMEPPAPDYDTDELPIPTSATLRLKQSPLESVTSTATRRYQKKTTSSAGVPRHSVANPTLPRDIPAPTTTQSAAFSIDDPAAPAAPLFPEQMLPGPGGMMEVAPSGPLMAGPPSPEGRRKSLGTIRERLGRFLSTLGQRSKQRQQQPQRGSRDYATGTIHNFSFADSKIGLLMVAEQQRQQGGGGGRGSPDGSVALETCSDIGVSRQSWWDVGTLSSARSAQLTVSSKGSTASSRTSRWAKFRKKSTSVPNLRAEEESGSVLSSSSGVGGSGLSSGGGSGGGGGQVASKSAQQRERSSSSGRDKKTAVNADKNKTSSPAVSPPARSSRSSSSSRNSSTASPPPLPPMRDADSTTHNDGARISGFLKKLTQGRAASRDRTRRQRAEPETVVSTLSYTRTYEEIPA